MININYFLWIQLCRTKAYSDYAELVPYTRWQLLRLEQYIILGKHYWLGK